VGFSGLVKSPENLNAESVLTLFFESFETLAVDLVYELQKNSSITTTTEPE
jgi:hypothetical protein